MQRPEAETVLVVGDRRIIVRAIAPDALTPNPDNTNRGRERGNSAISKSLQETGLHRGIVAAGDGTVIAGNHAYQAAVADGVAKGWIEIELPDGSIGVVTKRGDWRSARDPEAIKAAFYDNRTNELNYEEDPRQLVANLEVLIAAGQSFAPELLTEEELQEILGNAADEMLDEDGDGFEPQPVRCPHCGHEFNP